MLNSDIFNFEFVDRKSERDSVDNFLTDCQNSENVLWLSGKQGIGKSFFLTEYVKKKNPNVTVYIEGSLIDMPQGNYAKKIVSELNSISGMGFWGFIKNNYKSIIKIGKGVVNTVLSIADLEDFGIFDLTSAITDLLVSKVDEKDSMVTAFIKYTNSIEKKLGKVIIILDNFTECDSFSLDIILEMIHKLSPQNTIKFILCTTDERIEKRPDIISAIVEKIPHIMLKMLPFQQTCLFSRMIERSFDLDDTQRALLSLAFKICKGIPQNFKAILINLYTSQGIVLNNEKAQIITDLFSEILYKENITFNIDELCKSSPNAGRLLQLIACFGAPIRKDILINLLSFIMDMNNYNIFAYEIINLINQLVSNHILRLEYENNMEIVKFRHDSLNVSVINYFKKDKIIPLMQHKIYEFLMTEVDNDTKKTDKYWSQYYQPVWAYHAFCIKANEWMKINYEYAFKLLGEGLYLDAKSIFDRLENVLPQLSCEQLMNIGYTYFHCGEYKSTVGVLSIVLENCDAKQKSSKDEYIMSLIYLARAKSCLLEYSDALKYIEIAEKESAKESVNYISVMAAKQSILFLTPNGFIKAKKIFDDIVQTEKITKELSLVYQSAMDYYEGETSVMYLNKGLTIAQKFNDIRTCGKIYNNIGFEKLRCGEYLEAEKCFKSSISTLSQCQPHEQAYPYNNLAILNMINGEYENALDNISESLFWNKSEYLSLVLKVNRMLCYFYTGNLLWKELFDKLYEYIKEEKFVDDKIYKKICVNLALICQKNSEPFKGIEILELCKIHMQNEWENGKYRYNKLYSELTCNSFIPNSGTLQNRKYYCDIEFEPWLVNFSHD